MRQIILLFLLLSSSITASAQFPLGSDMNKIKTYFAFNIPYASAQEFRTENGLKAICFTKVKVVGDYVFYFDFNGLCTYYVVTYDKKELPDLIKRFDNRFCRMYPTKWIAEDNTYYIILEPPNAGENFFSIIYKPAYPNTLMSNIFAFN